MVKKIDTLFQILYSDISKICHGVMGVGLRNSNWVAQESPLGGGDVTFT